MKHFAIGDGHKRITAPDRYKADLESEKTTVLWDADHVDMPIRVTVITVTPKDKTETDAGFWHAIEKARKSNTDPRIDGNKAIHIHREECSDPNDVIHFYDVGFGNHFCIFSLTVAKSEEPSTTFAQVRADLDGMIHSLVERGEEEQFSCCLFEHEFDRINESMSSLLPAGIGDAAWSDLQTQFNRSFDDREKVLAGRVGLVFGELMRKELPSFRWSVKIDGDGRARALDLGDSGLSIFPEDMMLKRFDRNERLDLRQFASDTIETLERMYRKYREEA